MIFQTCDWCGYIYPQLKKAECPYCGARKCDLPKLKDMEEKAKRQNSDRKCA